MVVLVERTGVLLEASFRLCPPGFIVSSGASSEGATFGLSSTAPSGLSLLRTGLSFLLFFSVFVTEVFLHEWVVGPSHNPQSTMEDLRCVLDAYMPMPTNSRTPAQWWAQ